MRLAPWVLLLVGGCGASAPASSADVGGGLADVSWLAGRWRAGEGERVTEESWVPLHAGAWLGFNRTVERGRTVHHELLRLERVDEGVRYVAAPAGQAVTAFRLAGADDGGARFENPEHDFPTWIRYRLEGDGLVATIGGEGSPEPAATWRYARVGEARLFESAGRVCRDGDTLRVTLEPCHCGAEVFCAGFGVDGGIDVHVAVVDEMCDACTEAVGSCEVPAGPIRAVNGRSMEAIEASGCVDARLRVLGVGP